MHWNAGTGTWRTLLGKRCLVWETPIRIRCDELHPVDVDEESGHRDPPLATDSEGTRDLACANQAIGSRDPDAELFCGP